MQPSRPTKPPHAPKRARGLILNIPGGRFRRLMDESGVLTPAGTHHYEQTAQRAPDRGFDYSQEPIRRGARVQIKLLDGTQATVRTWDGVNGRWRFTQLGQKFYRES